MEFDTATHQVGQRVLQVTVTDRAVVPGLLGNGHVGAHHLGLVQPRGEVDLIVPEGGQVRVFS